MLITKQVTTDDLMTCRQCLLRLVPSRIQKRLEAKLTSARTLNCDIESAKVRKMLIFFSVLTNVCDSVFCFDEFKIQPSMIEFILPELF